MVRPWRWMPWGLAALSSMLLAANSSVNTSSAVPGSINYIEGQVSIEGQALTQKSVGVTQIDQNQILETKQGKAEILLTPGVYLRVGDASEVRMVSPQLTNTQAELVSGEGLVEADLLFKDSNISLLDDGAQIRLEKNGLYEFTAGTNPTVAVYDGQVEVDRGDEHLKLTKGHETDLSGPLHARKFDRDRHDELYAWSNLRSEYSSEASLQSAQTIVAGNWWGPGWYWNPGWGMYAFLPGDGFLYSPFGWGFYPPFLGYYPGFYGYGYGYGHRFYHGGTARTGSGFHTGGSVGARGFSGGGFSGARGMGGGHR